MSETMPRLALDMYVLAQGVKTGVYRVCDELFPLLSKSSAFDVRLFYREGDEDKPEGQAAARRIGRPRHQASGSDPSGDANILLSPFGVAPDAWLLNPTILHAHIVYDLIGINHPEFFTPEAAAEVRAIIDSLDEHTVVFAISEHTKRDLLAYRSDLSPAQITVIPLAAGHAFRPCESGAVREVARTKYGIPVGVPYVLSLATLEVRKNLDRVINAFALHLQQNPGSELHLVLSGMAGWKLEQLDQAIAAAHEWRHRIVLTGFIEDGDLSALYSDALCFVYLSRYEGFGLPPLEAMACGTPVICANNSSLPEVVGDAGVMLDADDVQGVADAIQRIATTPSYRARLSTAGLERSRLFNWERSAAILTTALCAAYSRHLERPPLRRQRPLTPGASMARRRRPDGVIQADFLGFSNGSQGPSFSRHSRGRNPGAPATWPRWADHLAAPAGSSRPEGGLRTRGIYKTGTVRHPLVTYVTVVRNNTSTLARTLQSVQQQTYRNVEHVVLDGASTDGTLDLIRRHGDTVDYFVSEPDSGLYDAVNKAIALARGQLICILNSDDWLEPRAAEIAVHRMGDCSGAAILLTTANVRGGHLDQEWYPAFVHPGCYFMCANDCHNGIYATRAAYERSGPYDTSYKIVADFKWIMTCMEVDATFVYTREVTVNYSLGGTSGDVRKHSLECMRVVKERFPFLTPGEVSGLYACFFLFAQLPDLADRPANATEFLREVFVRHAGEADFLQALAWASFEKMQHPADLKTVSMPVDPPPLVNAPAPTVKALVKHALKRSATADRFARRIYSMIKRG